MANALAWVSQSAGPSYLFQQDFESAGVPSGWTDGGGCTFHNTSSPLEGTGDLDVLAGATNMATATLSPSIAECYVVALLKLIALPSSGTSFWFAINNLGTPMCEFRIISDATVRCVNGSALGVNMSGPGSAGTLYYAKMYYKVGTGSNSLSTWELSTTGSWIGSGSLFQSVTTGPANSNVNRLQCRYSVSGNARFDHIRISATDLGSSFSNWP